MKKYDLIIARYNESLDWIKSLDPLRYNIIIYNKGANDIEYPSIPLKNIGRESQTFFYYIVDHYDNFSDFVIFVQGHPTEHDPEAIAKMNEHMDEEDVRVLSDHHLTEGIQGWYEPLLSHPPDYKITYLYEVAHKILGHPNMRECQFGAGAQYIVNSRIIMQRSKEFYQKILDMFETDYFLPWHMERLFLYVIGALPSE